MSLALLVGIALVQGLTEFLPVSSSGHLALIPLVNDRPYQGRAIDVAAHVGTLGAVLFYFRSDLAAMLMSLRSGGAADQRQMIRLLIIATVPVILCGLALKLTGLDDALRSITVIAWATILFGLLLWWSDQHGRSEKTAGDWTAREAVALGLWQAIALIPGTSRSGITITGARFLGYRRHDAARLSMLMSIPTIMASGALLGLETAMDANTALLRDGAIAAFLAFLAALLALSLMMRLLRSVSFTPYVIYRLGLGAVLLWIAYG